MKRISLCVLALAVCALALASAPASAGHVSTVSTFRVGGGAFSHRTGLVAVGYTPTVALVLPTPIVTAVAPVAVSPVVTTPVPATPVAAPAVVAAPVAVAAPTVAVAPVAVATPLVAASAYSPYGFGTTGFGVGFGYGTNVVAVRRTVVVRRPVTFDLGRAVRRFAR